MLFSEPQARRFLPLLGCPSPSAVTRHVPSAPACVEPVVPLHVLVLGVLPRGRTPGQSVSEPFFPLSRLTGLRAPRAEALLLTAVRRRFRNRGHLVVRESCLPARLLFTQGARNLQ